MSFTEYELSSQEGKPIYLLRFRRGSHSWYYTNTDRDIAYLGNTYVAEPVTIDDLIYSGDAKSDSVNIDLPSGNELTNYLDTGAVSSTVYVLIHRVHMIELVEEGDYASPTVTDDAPVIWAGEVNSYAYSALNRRVLRCNTISMSMARNGLRLTWGRQCNNVLYQPGCGVNRASYRRSLVGVSVENGLEVRVSNLVGPAPDGIVNGSFEWVMPSGIVESRGIQSYHTVGGFGFLSLFGGTRGVGGGSGYCWYPGCDRVIATCDRLFSNSDNFGGIKYLQGDNPFDNVSLFY